MIMIDAGTELGGPYEVAEKKKHYPRLTLDLGTFPSLNEVGKTVKLTIEAEIVGVRSDEYGATADVEVRKCGVGSAEAEKVEASENSADKKLKQLTGK